jgi:hypothetical protein
MTTPPKRRLARNKKIRGAAVIRYGALHLHLGPGMTAKAIGDMVLIEPASRPGPPADFAKSLALHVLKNVARRARIGLAMARRKLR